MTAKPNEADQKPARTLPEIAQQVTEALNKLKHGEVFPEIVNDAIALIAPPKTSALQLAEFVSNRFRLTVDASIDLRLLHHRPKFWSPLVGCGLHKFDEVRCVASDESAYADFIIMDADSKYVDAELIAYHVFAKRQRSQELTWLRGGDKLELRAADGLNRGGWVIVRADGIELISGGGVPFPDEESARRFYVDASWNKSERVVSYQH